MKTEWDMKLWYESDTDPDIKKDAEHDRVVVEEFNTQFKKKQDYSDKDYRDFLSEYEKICGILDCAKPLRYFSLRESLESGNEKVLREVTHFSEHYARLSSSLSWTVKIIAGIPDELVTRDEYKKYAYLISSQKKVASHVLGDEAEHAIQMLAIPGKDLFVQTREKFSNKRTVTWKDEVIPLATAGQKISVISDYAERGEFSSLITEEMKKDAELAEAELNSVILTKKIT
ncbi:MAG: hypothetical protein WDZ88_02460, partial [Candidatus Paceibacterota bacterium]